MRGPARRRLAAALAGAALLVPATGGCGSGELPRPDVVIVLSCDTLRADRLGAYGSDRGLTPNLDALAEDSLVFTHAYSVAPFTLPSVSALMTGRYPRETTIGVNEAVVPQAVPTLASHLEARGFAGGAVVSNYVLRATTGLDQGFADRFDDDMEEIETRRDLPERRAHSTTDSALSMADRLLATGSDRIFLWVHYQDPHGPYTPPPELLAETLPRELARPGGDRLLPLAPASVEEDKLAHTGIGWIPNYQNLDGHREVGYYVAAYDAEVRFMDAELGRLLAGLKERGLYDDALIVFTADHGEGMGERDYWFAHGEHVTDGCVNVPLLVRRPGVRPGRRDDTACLVDVVPTVLRAVGTTSPPILLGRDLLAPGAADGASPVYVSTLGAAYVPKLAFVEDGWKLECDFEDGPKQPTRYRLTRLGAEDTDLSGQDHDQAVELSARMNRFVEELARRKAVVDAQRTDLDRERAEQALGEMERLEGLGYVQGGTIKDDD